MTNKIDILRRVFKAVYELLIIVLSVLALGYLLIAALNLLIGDSKKRYYKR
jgi:hypothetical protein